MNPINMNLLQVIFINVFILCLDTTAVSQEVAKNTLLKKDDSRKNYTADDLILQLSKLASSNILPRQRFPLGDYSDYPDDPQQYPLYSDYPNPNEQYYDQNYLAGQYGLINYPPRPYPFRRRPKKTRYPQFPQYDPQYPVRDGPFQGAFSQFFQRPGSPFPFGPGPFSPYQEGPFDSLTRALSSIARYDDQQCVPRLLCEVAAGGNPSGKQNSFLPSFLSMGSLFTLLSAFAGEQVSPFLTFGRAAVLGVTSQGNPSSCNHAYPECPRDPDRLVDYLNNHNGGFFRFFNGIQQQQDPGVLNYPPEGDQFGNYDQNFNRPGQNYPQYPDDINQNYNRPGQKYPQYINENYNQGGQYAQNYPQYMNDNNQNYNRPGQKYPQYVNDNYNQAQYSQNYNRPGQRYPQYSHENYNQRPEDYNDNYKRKPGSNTRFPNKYESRILNVNSTEENEARIQNKPSLYSNQDLYIAQSYRYPKVYSENGQALKFPEASTNYNPIVVPNLITNQYDPYTKTHLKFPSDDRENKKIKSLFFPGQENVDQNQLNYYPKPLPFYDHTKMIFPDRTGTGNLKFDSENLHQTTRRPDIYNNYYSNYVKPNNYYENQQSPSQKYVYIVRGNGDPNHPEKVPIEYARQARVNEDVEVIEIENKDGLDEGSGESSWKFPSAYQGVVYNDRSFNV